MAGHAVVWAVRKTEGEREGGAVWPALVTSTVSVRHFRTRLLTGGAWSRVLREPHTCLEALRGRMRGRSVGGSSAGRAGAGRAWEGLRRRQDGEGI